MTRNQYNGEDAAKEHNNNSMKGKEVDSKQASKQWWWRRTLPHCTTTSKLSELTEQLTCLMNYNIDCQTNTYYIIIAQ